MSYARTLALALLAVAMPLAAAADGNSCTTGCIDTQEMDIHEISVDSTQTYQVAAAKTKGEMDACLDQNGDEQLCRQGGPLKCEASVEYPQMRYLVHRYGDVPDRNLAQINARIATLAKAHSCSPGFSDIRFSAERIYARGRLLSLVFFDLRYPRGGGGSCHGHYLTMTFDTLAGAEPMPLSAAVRMEEYPALRQALLQELKAQNPSAFSRDSPTQRQQAWQRVLRDADNYLRDEAPDGGFYIEGGQLHLNLGLFVFDCADGNFHGLSVPDRFLTPRFRALLDNARAH